MKFKRSFALLKASWGVLSDDKELLWLPVISGICALVVAASFGVPIFLTSNSEIRRPRPVLLKALAKRNAATISQTVEFIYPAMASLSDNVSVSIVAVVPIKTTAPSGSG